MFKLVERECGEVTVLDVSGRIVLGDATCSLREAFQDLVRRGKKKVLLNFGEVVYLDGNGVGELVSGFTTTTNHGGALKLFNLRKKVKDLFQLTNLNTVFEIYEDKEAAIRSFEH